LQPVWHLLPLLPLLSLLSLHLHLLHLHLGHMVPSEGRWVLHGSSRWVLHGSSSSRHASLYTDGGQWKLAVPLLPAHAVALLRCHLRPGCIDLRRAHVVHALMGRKAPPLLDRPLMHGSLVHQWLVLLLVVLLLMVVLLLLLVLLLLVLLLLLHGCLLHHWLLLCRVQTTSMHRIHRTCVHTMRASSSHASSHHACCTVLQV
jgi:hypothetical protein